MIGASDRSHRHPTINVKKNYILIEYPKYLLEYYSNRCRVTGVEDIQPSMLKIKVFSMISKIVN